MDSDLFDEDHELFRASVREFVDKHVVPKLHQRDADRLIDRETWRTAGKHGLLGLAAPKEFGGPEQQDYRYRVVIQQEIARVGASALQSGFSTNDDIVLNYLLRHADAGQRERWVPGNQNQVSHAPRVGGKHFDCDQPAHGMSRDRCRFDVELTE